MYFVDGELLVVVGYLYLVVFDWVGDGDGCVCDLLYGVVWLV